ncbi:endolysin [Streptomyces phage Wofford]|uniref:Endolysin n=1 Tax=Streptomyces phage Wofford TaxID=2283267 RepID=A0A345M9R4_9CAUD|nr:transglycosylase [Streptomyces phage Wollford]AXH67235.1 endolysin [Streptomyces phage Wollford]
MDQKMKGNIASMALCLGVAAAVFAQAASDMGALPLEAEKPNVTQSVSPKATPSTNESPVVNVPKITPPVTLNASPVAYSNSVKSSKDYAYSKIKGTYKKTYKTQWPCLNNLWIKESSWNYKAKNPYSGAYGIPQALPATKMASAGKDWKTNARTQINWGLHKYIYPRYGTPCNAWSHFKRKGWY